MVRTGLAMAALLVVAGCGGDTIVSRNGHADVPRDARGEPVFASIPPPPPPATPPPPAVAAATGVVVATGVVAVTGDSTASAPAALPPVAVLPPPAKPVSCRHFRRCL